MINSSAAFIVGLAIGMVLGVIFILLDTWRSR